MSQSFDFEPKFILIFGEGTPNYGEPNIVFMFKGSSHQWINGQSSGTPSSMSCVINSDTSGGELWNFSGKTISWYAYNNAYRQLNTSGTRYNYCVMG